MAAHPRRIRTQEELAALRALLHEAQEYARRGLRSIVEDPRLLRLLKFENHGCDPFDASDPQNLLEQINQQATYEVALDAAALLMARHPTKEWKLAPGAWSDGSDVESTDGAVAAEVFAAVDPKNNKKLEKDIERAKKAGAANRYVVYRAPTHGRSERTLDGITIISLGMD